MTSVMTTIDAPAAPAPAEPGATRALDARSAERFGALVQDALGTLENGGNGTDTSDAEVGPSTEDDREVTSSVPSDSPVTPTVIPVLLPAVSTAPNPAPGTAVAGAPIAATATAGTAAVEGATGSTPVTDEPDAPPATEVDPMADDAATSVASDMPAGSVAADDAAPKVPALPDRSDAAPGDAIATASVADAQGTDPSAPTGPAPTESETADHATKPELSDLRSTALAESVPNAAPDAATELTNEAAAAPAAADGAERGNAWEQVARAARSVRRDEDGNHTMTVRLDPPELGTVELEVQIRDGRLHLHAASDSTATRELLARAMPELRAALDADGIATGSLDVGARAGGHGTTGHAGPGGDATGERHPGSGRPGLGGTGSAGGVATHSPDQPGDAPASTRLDLRL